MLWRCSEDAPRFFFFFLLSGQLWSKPTVRLSLSFISLCRRLSFLHLCSSSYPCLLFHLSIRCLFHRSLSILSASPFVFFFFFPFLFFPFRFVVNAMGKCKFLPWLPFHLPTCSTLCSGILHSLKILSHNPTPSSPLVAFIKLINHWLNWLMNSLMLQDTLGWFEISLGCR